MKRKPYIVVAEDDADDRFLLQTAFLEKGFTDPIEFVENGVDLIRFLNQLLEQPADDKQFPRFILLDLNMPKKNGKETLSEIKSHPIWKTIPVIVYTTTKSEAEILKCYELGANTYIVKPARFEMLLQVVEDLRKYWFETATMPS